MGSQNIIKLIAALVSVVAVLSATTVVAPPPRMGPAPAPVMECTKGLPTCFPYLNTTTKPSLPCCYAIKNLMEDEACLCYILSPTHLASHGITQEQALSLPARCSIPVDASTCKAGPPSSPPAPSPGKGKGKDKGGANQMVASSGLIVTLLFIWGFALFF